MALTRLCEFCLEARTECVCPDTEAPDDAYRGVIVIEWPAPHGASPYSSMTGWKVTVTDAVTRRRITTATGISVRVSPESLVTADLTVFTDADGEPVLDGQPVMDGGEIRTGTFTFLVTEMRVRERQR